MDRRNFLGRMSSLIPLSVIPFTKATGIVDVKQSETSYNERGKYLAYTERDWMWCKLILLDAKGHKIWAPPINKVILTKDPFQVELLVKHEKPPRDTTLTSVRFVDKDKRMLFQAKPFVTPVICHSGDILNLTYNIRLD